MLSWISKNAVATIAIFAFLTLSVMVVYQARVIDGQRTLIRDLTGDSLELNARKVHDVQVKLAQRRK
jgi:hypothetical protein